MDLLSIDLSHATAKPPRAERLGYVFVGLVVIGCLGGNMARGADSSIPKAQVAADPLPAGVATPPSAYPLPPAPAPGSLGAVPNAKKLGAGIPPFKESAPTAGKEPNPFGSPLTLAKALELAILRNWDLLVTKTNIDQSRAVLLMAKEFPNPTLSLSTARLAPYGSSTSLGNGIFQRSYDSIAAVSQFIEIGGKRKWRQLAAKHGLLNAESLFQDAERQLKDGVIHAYANVLHEDELVAILRQSEDTLKEEAKIAKHRLEVGAIAESDEQQLEITAERFAADRVVEEANARNARVQLELLLAAPNPRGTIKLANKLGDISEQLLKQKPIAKGERPDLVAAKETVAQMEASLKLAIAGRIPDLTISTQGEHNPNPPFATNTMGFGVSLPIPIWNQNQGAINLARAQKESAELALKKISAMVISDATQAWATYHATKDKWLNYRDTITLQSRASLAAVKYAYEKGGLPLVSFLDAIRSDNDVRTGTSQAAFDNVGATADLQATQPYVRF